MIYSKTSARFFLNRNARAAAVADSFDQAPRDFHRRLRGYAVTPLLRTPEIARTLGVGEVWLKIESNRLGLPAFKILGASWAIHRALQKQPSARALTTATDGNHGRAVAHMAKLLRLDARIYLPAGTAQARIDGIASEGARVEIVDGTYDEAVARAAQDASEDCLVISDTSWPGYEDVPRWVMEGYSTIFSEIDEELARLDEAGPDLVAIQFGVGALAAAAVQHYRAGTRAPQPSILSVEPLHAACALASMEAGKIVDVCGPHDSIMAGLNCGRVSLVAWPAISCGIDAFIAIEDERARQAMRLLAQCGVVAGETGAAGVAGLLELLTGSDQAQHRAALGIAAHSRVLALVTEGATDPENYQAIVADTSCSNERVA